MPDTIKAVQRRLRLRPATRWLHTWGGIILGGVVSVICLTGSVIVFRHEVERAPSPRNSTAAGAPGAWSLDSAARDIGRLQPGATITRVWFPASPDDPYVPPS
jgi:uncharacterized iron-regulated membrane protein